MFGGETNRQRISVLSATDSLCNEHEKVTQLEKWPSPLQRMWVGHCFMYCLFMANVPMCDKLGKYSWNPCLTTKPNESKAHHKSQTKKSFFWKLVLLFGVKYTAKRLQFVGCYIMLNTELRLTPMHTDVTVVLVHDVQWSQIWDVLHDLNSTQHTHAQTGKTTSAQKLMNTHKILTAQLRRNTSKNMHC